MEPAEEGGTSREGSNEVGQSVRKSRLLSGAWLKSLLCQPHLVDPLDRCIPSLWICVCRPSKGYGGDLALDV